MGHPPVKPEKVGEILRRARETRKLGLEEIAKRTKISQRFLGAIENGKYGILPSDVFVRGFLRSYAATLGLDPEEMVELYKQERGIAIHIQEEEVGKPLPLLILWVGAAAVLLLLAAVLAFIFWPRKAPPAAIPDQGAFHAPVPVEPAPVVPVPGGKESVEILFSRHCWALVRVDGNRVFEGFKESGDQLQYRIERSFYIKVGDAGAVTVTHGGKPYPKLGDDGQPVELNIAAGKGETP
ncbi:MAG TPA: hypothetical protein DCS11_08225 [Syntrophus sp. (in: bacteria)]|jgi:transcriptional regulator with XRE-family HTH domain|nr:hypothetical protein [Syntrophus sp. (in: bacteria)]